LNTHFQSIDSLQTALSTIQTQLSETKDRLAPLESALSNLYDDKILLEQTHTDNGASIHTLTENIDEQKVFLATAQSSIMTAYT
jgi:chromosome segregation ATPase